MAESYEEFKEALKEFGRAFKSTRLCKILISIMDWTEEHLESLSNRIRGGRK